MPKGNSRHINNPSNIKAFREVNKVNHFNKRAYNMTCFICGNSPHIGMTAKTINGVMEMCCKSCYKLCI